MNEKKLAGWAASSANSEEVSNRVKGIILTLSSVIILFSASLFNIQLTADDVVSLGTSLGTVAGAVWALWGGLLAVVRWVASVRA